MINILFVTYNLNTYSGAAFQALKLADNLKPTHNIIICNFTNVKNNGKYFEYNKNDVKVVDIFDNLFSVLFFLKILLKYKIKIVHFHVFLLIKIIISKLFIGKVILKTTLLGTDDFETAINSSMIGIVKKWAINLLDYNIVLSDKIKNINSYFLKNIKILKIPNAVEIPLNIYLEKNEIYCCVGIICERKQVLESIKFYHKNLFSKKSILYLIGPNSISDNTPEFVQSYYIKCKQYIKINNLGNNIIFTGNLTKNDLMNYYKISKSIIHFSKKEGMPNVVLEAMAFNCVPIVTEMDGVAHEIIDHNFDGIVIKNLDNFIFDKLKFNEIANSSRPYDKIFGEFSFDKITRKYCDIYFKLINDF